MERRPVNHENQAPRMPRPFDGNGVSSPAPDTPRAPVALRTDVLAPVERRDGLRALLAGLGVWLFASAFIWPHGEASLLNTVVVGAMLAACGLFAHRPMARMSCGALGAWLVLSTLSIAPRAELTFWNNLVVGIATLVLAFLPGGGRRAG